VRAHSLLLLLSGAVVWVAYGCGGESETRASRSGAGTGASGRSGVGKGGGSGQGGTSAARGGGIPELRGGSSGKGESGAPTGGSATGGGTGGGAKGGAVGRGGTSGRGGDDVVGGAGSGCLEELKDAWGDSGTFDHCCVGDSWGYDEDYYDSSPSSCGDARICDVAIYLDVCQDRPFITDLRSRCCADGRWHIVDGDRQYEPESFALYLLEDQRSPACDGTVHHSSRALHFDGSSYLELPVEADGIYPEIEIWFRTSVPNGPLLTSTAAEHRLYLSGGKVCFASAGTTPLTLCTPEADFADGAWHHAAHTLRGVYADGTLRVEGYDANTPGNVTAFRVGYGPVDDGTALEYFVGDLDEIRIWRQRRYQTAILDY
jgi:hypothetical protein